MSGDVPEHGPNSMLTAAAAEFAADPALERTWFVWETDVSDEGGSMVVVARTKEEAEMRVRCEWSRPHQALLRETELVVVEATAEELAERSKLEAEEEAREAEIEAFDPVVEVPPCVDPACPTTIAGICSSHWHTPRFKHVPAKAVGP